jgi:hypothetical protein
MSRLKLADFLLESSDDESYDISEDRPEDVTPKEDAWAGGDNLVNQIEYEKVQKMLEACGCQGPDLSHQYSKMREEGPYWHGPGCETQIPDMDTYRGVGDILIRNPALIEMMLEPLLQVSDTSCPVSAAMAIADVVDLYSRDK